MRGGIVTKLKDIHIKPAGPNGARRVMGTVNGIDWRDIGTLMPELADSRQQPKSLAMRLREELNRETEQCR